MSTVEIDQAAPECPSHHALPDPGESVPKLALPTVGIFLVALTAFVLSTPSGRAADRPSRRVAEPPSRRL